MLKGRWKRWIAGQIIAMLVVGTLTGFGLLLGFPLAVVLDISIRRLYVRDTLGERVQILGKPAQAPRGVERGPR
jgi:hypothetical protein